MASPKVRLFGSEWRKRLFLGPLPPDFLRISTISTIPKVQQESADSQASWALHRPLLAKSSHHRNVIGRLNVTIAQAKLVKNYGLTAMDPYVRLSVGHGVYETQADPKGGKNPRWNKLVQCPLPRGIDTIYIEIYDECSFTMDQLIAWTHIPIDENVLNGETTEEWYLLNGRQGEGREGIINLVISFTYATPQYSQIAVQSIVNAQHIVNIEEMFPNIDREVVKSVYEANAGDKDATINSLLQMSDI